MSFNVVNVYAFQVFFWKIKHFRIIGLVYGFLKLINRDIFIEILNFHICYSLRPKMKNIAFHNISCCVLTTGYIKTFILLSSYVS